MKILSGSVAQAADNFLHAGYISAYPRQLEPHNLGTAEPQVQLDMAEALRLQGETLAAAAPSGMGEPLATVAATGGGEWHSTLFVAACLIGLTVALYIYRRALLYRPLGAAGAAVLILAAVGLPGCSTIDPLPTKAPWEGVRKQIYANPQAATLALLYGIIADGIANLGRPVTNLANIQNEVGLPLTTPTRGMSYALKTYGLDGWGREFRLSGDEKTGYTVTSSGADGAFDNADDVKVVVKGCTDETWDNERWAFFVRKEGTTHSVYFHRWTGEHFKYRNETTARTATGGGLFDLFKESELEQKQAATVKASFDKVAAGVKHKPLVLQIYRKAG